MIQYIKGDATEPQGDGRKLILHVVNSVGKWGAGFVLAVSKKWPDVEMEYRKWHGGAQAKEPFQLGNIQAVKAEKGIAVINMIGQDGIKPKNGLPPIRYGAIDECLKKVAKIAKDHDASVHCPKFGAGLAGGEWYIIEAMIEKRLCEEGIDVTVYEFEEN